MERIQGCSYRRPARSALPQQRSWIGRGEAMLQIRFGGQLRDLICRKLAPQEASEQLAEFQARAFERQILAGGTAASRSTRGCRTAWRSVGYAVRVCRGTRARRR